MIRNNPIALYLVLSMANGIVPFAIALVLSVSGFYALLIWGAASAATFMLICMVCLRSAIEKAELAPKKNLVGAELEKAAV